MADHSIRGKVALIAGGAKNLGGLIARDLAGCAYAFEHDDVSIFQVVCRRAGQGAASLAWSRRYMYERELS